VLWAKGYRLMVTPSGVRGEMPELAEGARLEIVCSVKSGTVGSNPTLSAISFLGSREFTEFQDDVSCCNSLSLGLPVWLSAGSPP
jgi:hypothetical protein